MPFLKSIDKFQPPWKEWDQKAQKEGWHATFYSTNKDEYRGDWHNNKKEGKGVYKWINKGQIYEGEWKKLVFIYLSNELRRVRRAVRAMGPLNYFTLILLFKF
jgi:hypothetical protein